MLHHLIVENIALIDRLEIEFSEGLNVLTGETGAGKSIIVGSMNLILGERADRELIRRDQEKARVEALLYVTPGLFADLFEQYGIPSDEELVVSRELSVSGKNVCRINGITVNLSILKEFMNRIVDLHGQHEHQSLLYPANHVLMLDSFGGGEITALHEKIAEQYAALHTAEARLRKLGGSRDERAHAAELLEFQIRELEEAQVLPGEVEALKTERRILAGAQEIATTLFAGYHALYLGDGEAPGILSALKNIVDATGRFSDLGEDYEQLHMRLADSYYALEEITHELGAQAETVVFDEQRQMEVEDRIEWIQSLKRKYNAADEEELERFFQTAQERYEELINADALCETLLAEIRSRKDRLYGFYTELSEKRRQTAEQLQRLVLMELRDLGMPHSKFEVRFDDLPPKETAVFLKDGIDHLEFYISTNAGEPLKPLSKTASGGEISRIMLAFKNISAGIDRVSTLIFDEIDTGISGRMAHVVAEKMAAISKKRQVICVTHLPQIAAMADRNFLITKTAGRSATNTSIVRLDREGVLQEIARLSGGLNTASAAVYAQELLENAANIKKSI